jgi:hypothetical protein
MDRLGYLCAVVRKVDSLMSAEHNHAGRAYSDQSAHIEPCRRMAAADRRNADAKCGHEIPKGNLEIRPPASWTSTQRDAVRAAAGYADWTSRKQSEQ